MRERKCKGGQEEKRRDGRGTTHPVFDTPIKIVPRPCSAVNNNNDKSIYSTSKLIA